MNTRVPFLAATLASFLFGACSSEDTSPAHKDPSPIENENNQPGQVARSTLPRESEPQISEQAKIELVEGHNAFALQMYDLIRKDEGVGENMFFSPTSMLLALSMAYAGAQGDTANEMKNALHFALPPEQLAAGFNWLDQTLEGREEAAYKVAVSEAAKWDLEPPSRDDFRLHIVNSIWGEAKMTFEQPFLDTLARHYDAGVFLSDFRNNPEVERVRINDWVAEETWDRIQDLLPPGTIDTMTRTVLVNAIHLKLPWDEEFRVVDDMSFHRLDGSTMAVPTIANTKYWPYLEEDGLQAVRVPLKGGNIDLVIIAPAQGQLDAFESRLTTDGFASIFDKMETREVALHLPKVKFTTPSVSLTSKLQIMGMNVHFTSSADFSGITKDESLFISDVVHKAMLGIDEHGVEAAAATAVVMAGSGVPDPVDFDVDRPFFVGIVDKTNTVLFAGHIVDPTK
ncbi:MAG TPA: serpin family protein [Polyangiaceae bacterium]|nr:serpin family protein [Polyangiaceae bacterium]